MTNPVWKQAERRIAALLGGRRVPVSGRARGDVPDVAHPLWSVEVKHRRQIPGWLWEATEQAQAAALPGQAPLVVIHQHGMPYAKSLIVMPLGDFLQQHATETEA